MQNSPNGLAARTTELRLRAENKARLRQGQAAVRTGMGMETVGGIPKADEESQEWNE